MNEITDMTGYLQKMKNGLEDKMFFLEDLKKHSEIKNFVDFGCADGQILISLRKFFPSLNLIGYDINPYIYNKNIENAHLIKFTSNFIDLLNLSNSAILFSSVFHEIFSYTKHSEINTIFDLFLSEGFKRIYIRDMFHFKENERMTTKKELLSIKEKISPTQIAEFEYSIGSISFYPNFLQLLSKYTYFNNWERESRENYFSITPDYLIKRFSSRYKIAYRKDFTLPYFQNNMQKNFGLNILSPTHSKIILERI